MRLNLRPLILQQFQSVLGVFRNYALGFSRILRKVVEVSTREPSIVL